MIISQRQRKILKILVRNFDEIEESGDVNRLLFEIQYLVVRYGMTRDREFVNKFGKFLEKLHEEILEQNRNS